MFVIPESPLTGQILTLIKPVGKEIPFRVGEIIQGLVSDIFPGGGLTIKVKGGFLPARTDLDFQKNETLFLKVLGQGSDGGELMLQFLGRKPGPDESSPGTKLPSGVEVERIKDLTQKLSDMILKLMSQGTEEGKISGSNTTPRSLDVQKIQVLLEGLLKALPSNIQAVPKELRNQIQQILQYSLKGVGQDIQERIIQLLNQLPEGMNGSLGIQSLKDALISMEGLLSGKLQTALENSGVVLEAKLKTMVDSNLNLGQGVLTDSSKIQKDLKAILLQLKAVLQQKGEQEPTSGFFQKLLGGIEKGQGEAVSPFQKVQEGVDTLLKDVETYQLLSKISDSFYTFLPIQWNELKRGELVFKRRQQSGGISYSCAIHLDLETLGPVSVFIVMQSRDFYVNFRADHHELKAMIRAHLAELQENFNRQGLNLKNCSFLGRGDNQSDPFDRIESEETIISIRI